MKLVREHISEKFIEDSDPIDDLGIGLKHQIDEWIEFINKTIGSTTAINHIAHNYKINKRDGSIDIGLPISENDVLERALDKFPETIAIRGNIITELPDFIKFNKCYGNCYFNVSSIKSLRGCPQIVYGCFCINDNYNLEELDFLPQIVYGSFYAMRCKGKFSEKEIRKRCQVYKKIQI